MEHRYLSTEEEVQGAHARMAAILQQQPLFFDEGNSAVNVRRVGQLPFHLNRCGQADACVGLLGDLLFAEAKCACGLVYDLLEDFHACEAALPAKQLERHPDFEAFAELKQMIAFNLPILSRMVR